jgi:hypothetical protein
MRKGRACPRLGGAVIGMAVLFLPGLAAAAAYKYVTVETWGWRAELPEGWKQVEAKKDIPSKPYDALWRYHSVKSSWRLRVAVRTIKKPESDFKVRTRNTFERLVKRIPDIELLRANTIKIGERPVFYLLARANRERKGEKLDFLYFKMFSFFPKRKLQVAVTLSVANDKLENFLEVAERFMESFELVDPKSADEALKTHGAAVDAK